MSKLKKQSTKINETQNTARNLAVFFEIELKNSWEIPGEYEWLFKLESFVNKLCFWILFLNLFGK